MSILKGYSSDWLIGWSQDWLIGWGLGHPTIAVSQQEGQGSSSCSVLNASCLTTSNLALESFRIPRKLLVSSLPWHPKDVVLILAKECHSNKIAGLSCESEGRQAKN